MASEGHDVVQVFSRLLDGDNFLKEESDGLVLVPSEFCRILNPGGIVGWIQVLGAVGLEIVVEEVRVNAVPSEILEVQVQVIVETVATHA